MRWAMMLAAMVLATGCDDGSGMPGALWGVDAGGDAGDPCGPTGLTVDDYLPSDIAAIEPGPVRACIATFLIAAQRAEDCVDEDGQALIGNSGDPAWARQLCERHPEYGIALERCVDSFAADACGDIGADGTGCALYVVQVREVCR